MKQIIHTDNAPAAIGPYSQAVRAGNTLYISGQIPIDPATGKVVEGNIREQTEQVMKNIGAVLRAAGGDYDKVVKSTCLMADMNDFAAMNEVYARHMGDARPARAAVEVSRLPRGVDVEIDAIAIVP